jgi:hypothetical protein
LAYIYITKQKWKGTDKPEMQLINYIQQKFIFILQKHMIPDICVIIKKTEGEEHETKSTIKKHLDDYNV